MAGDIGSFIFNANEPGGYSQMELRRKIALAMLGHGKGRGYPKNVGEGLTAIGDSLGDLGTMRRLEAMAAAESAGDKGMMAKIYGGQPGAVPVPAAPPVPRSVPRPQSAVETPDAVPVADAGMPQPTDYVYSENQYNPLDQSSDLRDQRAPYVAQLDADPEAKLKMAGLMSAEEGGGAGNSTARQALAETIFNRGLSRGYSDVGKVMDPRYYEPMQGSGAYERHVARLQSDPAYRAQVMAEIDKVGREGTNVSNLATDNASGQVAANARGNQSVAWQAPNQELFTRKDVRPDVHGPGAVAATANWYNRLALSPTDPQAAPMVAAAPPPPTPISPTAAAQDDTLGQLSGRVGGAESYPPTASRGDLASDAPPLG